MASIAKHCTHEWQQSTQSLRTGHTRSRFVSRFVILDARISESDAVELLNTNVDIMSMVMSIKIHRGSQIEQFIQLLCVLSF